MGASLPHLSTDQVAAFVELARQGQIRSTAGVLGITEQGVRNRLLTLEAQVGVELYRKSRGPRRAALLTDQGRRFLPHALAFLERAHELCRAFDVQTGNQEVRIAASQYLTRYVLVDVLRDFRATAPEVTVRVSTMNERDVEESLLRDSELAFGLAAPYEPSPELTYHELFSMQWSAIFPPGEAPKSKRPLRLEQIAGRPLILYERGSTGRQHVLDAFNERGLIPRVTLETTSTETIVSMVEAGLGLSIVPLLPDGAVTRGRQVEVRALDAVIREIHSGMLVRKGEKLSRLAAHLLEFTKRRGILHRTVTTSRDRTP